MPQWWWSSAAVSGIEASGQLLPWRETRDIPVIALGASTLEESLLARAAHPR
jgi:hypothetical protein